MIRDARSRPDTFGVRRWDVKTSINTEGAPKAIGPYSQAIKANGFLYSSGQIAIDPRSGQMTALDIVGQTRQVMENLRGILASENLGFEDVVKATLYVTDLGDFQQINDVYGSYFSSDPPARSTVQVAALPKGAKLEIEIVAALPNAE